MSIAAERAERPGAPARALTCHQGWLAALRGDAATAETILAALPDLRASEDPQDKTLVSTAEAFAAAIMGLSYGGTVRVLPATVDDTALQAE